jgi:hypothetical protein
MSRLLVRCSIHHGFRRKAGNGTTSCVTDSFMADFSLPSPAGGVILRPDLTPEITTHSNKPASSSSHGGDPTPAVLEAIVFVRLRFLFCF